MNTSPVADAVRRSFGVSGTNAPVVPVGSSDDLMDAFHRYAVASGEPQTFAEFLNFVQVVRETGCSKSGLQYYPVLLAAYVERMPDLGWERCARQVWPLLAEAEDWVIGQKIAIEEIGVRPVFEAVHGDVTGTYQIRAFLCNHSSGGNCDCGAHGSCH